MNEDQLYSNIFFLFQWDSYFIDTQKKKCKQTHPFLNESKKIKSKTKYVLHIIARIGLHFTCCQYYFISMHYSICLQRTLYSFTVS